MTEQAPSPSLTRDFLQATKEKIVFQPSSMEEVEYIARQLLSMGYKYYSTEYPNKLKDALSGSIYLDTDKTIMVTTSKANGLAATADGFDNLSFAQTVDAASARIKPAEIMSGKFAFFPRTVAEGRGILTALKAAGATVDSAESTFKQAGLAVYQGLYVQEGHIGFGPSGDQLRGMRIATAADLGVGVPVALSPEQATIMAAFNELTARLEQVNSRLERLEKEIIPAPVAKTKLPAPGAS